MSMGKQYLNELLSSLKGFAGIPQERVTAISEYIDRLERELAEERESVEDLTAETTRLTDAMIAHRLDAAEAREQLSAALSVQPAAAVVGEPVAYRWKLRESCPWGYSLFARDDVYVCEPLYAAPSAPDGWQPIETAPKDETTIWVLDELYGKPWHYECNWNGIEWYHGFGVAWPDARPTHWRPLPAPPALGGASHE